MAVALGHSSKNIGSSIPGTTSRSWSHDCTGDNLLIVSMTYRTGNIATRTVSCTYNSVAMTLVSQINYAAQDNMYEVCVFKLANPASGSNTIYFLMSGNTFSCFVAIGSSFSGANGGAGSLSGEFGYRTPLSQSANIATGDALLAFGSSKDTSTPPSIDGTDIDSGGTTSGNALWGGADYKTGSGSVSCALSFADGQNSYLGVLPILAEAPSSIKTINGLAKDAVKTKNGLAIASVKNWNGLV